MLAMTMSCGSNNEDESQVPDKTDGTITITNAGNEGTPENPAIATAGHPATITLSQKSTYQEPDGSTFTCQPQASIHMTVDRDTVRAKTLADLLKLKLTTNNNATTGENPSVVSKVQDYNVGDLTVSFDIKHEVYTHRNTKGKDIEMPYLRLSSAKLGEAHSEEQAAKGIKNVSVRGVKLTRVAPSSARRIKHTTEQAYHVQVSFTIDAETVHQEDGNMNTTYSLEADYVGIVETTKDYPDPTLTYDYTINPLSGTTDKQSPFTISADATEMKIDFQQTAQYSWFDFTQMELRVVTYEPKAYVEVNTAKVDTIWVSDISELEKKLEPAPTITNSGDNPVENTGIRTFEVAKGQKITCKWGDQTYKPITVEGTEVKLPYLTLSTPEISDIKVAEVANGTLIGKKGKLYTVTITVSQDLTVANASEPKSEHLQYVVKFLAAIAKEQPKLVNIKYRKGDPKDMWREPHDNIPLAYQYLVYQDSIFSDGSVRTAVTSSGRTALSWALDITSNHGHYDQRKEDVRGVPVYYFAKQADLLDEAYINVKVSRKIAVPDISLVTLEEGNLAKTEPDKWTRYPQYNPSAPKPGWYWSDFGWKKHAYIYYNYAGGGLTYFGICSVWYNHILYVEDSINGGQLIDFLGDENDIDDVDYRPHFDFSFNEEETTMPTGEPAKVFTHTCITTFLGKQFHYEIVDSVYQYDPNHPPF
ncbi:MAG: hypothetical protein IJK42_03205 [Prevotella sp.]|nr:hypothetical protein [Prevotella sp.]